MRASPAPCEVRLPTLCDLLYAVDVLKRLYPRDEIHPVSLDALKAAVEASRQALLYTRGDCISRTLTAAAVLFYELIERHPLSDGNKRLATLVLRAFLDRNGLPQPRIVYRAAVATAKGEWGLEEVTQWLHREILEDHR